MSQITLRQYAAVKAYQWATKALPQLVGVSRQSWALSAIRESYTGAWQQNVTIELTNVLTHPTVFACVTLIAGDVSKIRLRLVEMSADGIWTETESAAFSPVLRIPNHYQTRQEFIWQWVISKLVWGNAYILKERDDRRIVTSLYVLNPQRVKPLIAPDGAVYYDIGRDDLAGKPMDNVTLPASEVIHDKMNAIYNSLVGLSPIYACGLAAVLGLKIQTNSVHLFQNSSSPGGFITVPGAIAADAAARVQKTLNEGYSGTNYGKWAVLSDGMMPHSSTQTAVDAQLIDQWKATAEAVCSAFHVPAYMVGVGPAPTYANIEPLNIQYYQQALQVQFESIEAKLDDGLGLSVKIDGRWMGTEFDLDDLLKMDTATMIEAEAKAIGGSLKKPNESRKRLNLPPVEGGDDVYSQQQNWSLAALSRRDEMALNPPPTPATLPQGTEDEPPETETEGETDEDVDETSDAEKALLWMKVKETCRLLLMQ